MSVQEKDSSARSHGSESLMFRLKDATSEHHRKAEGRRLQKELAKGVLPRDVFAAYLGQLAHVHRALETLLAASAANYPAIATVFRSRCKREDDLRADLKYYGQPVSEPSEPTRHLIAEFEDWGRTEPVALLGALYVLEGSGNGNRIIARILARNWSLSGSEGLRYMNPYGDDQPQTWSEFRSDMNAADIPSEQQASILAAAQRTFDGIGEVSDGVYSS